MLLLLPVKNVFKFHLFPAFSEKLIQVSGRNFSPAFDDKIFGFPVRSYPSFRWEVFSFKGKAFLAFGKQLYQLSGRSFSSCQWIFVLVSGEKFSQLSACDSKEKFFSIPQSQAFSASDEHLFQFPIRSFLDFQWDFFQLLATIFPSFLGELL